LECELARVHFVERAVDNGDFDIDDGVASQNTSSHRLFDPVDDSRDVFFWNSAPDDIVFNFDAFAAFVRLEGNHGVSILSPTAGLADELAFAFGGFGHRFPVSNLRSASVGCDLELAEQTVANNFQMQLTHSGNDKLARFLIGEAAERWVFLSQ